MKCTAEQSKINQQINDEIENDMHAGNSITPASNGTTAANTVSEPSAESVDTPEGPLFNQGSNLVKSNNIMQLPTVDLNQGDLPDLDDADVIPLDMASNYWSPVNVGENKRVYFDKIEVMQVQDNNDKEVVIDLPCVFMFEKTKGDVKTFQNGSKRLVAIFERSHIERGTPVIITYLGKKKNSTNSFLSDDWSVKPLLLKIKG